MPLEQEVMGMLVGGFSIIMGITVITTLVLWSKNKHNSLGYIWTLLHLILFSIAIFFALKALDSDYNQTMASEMNSLQIGISGVVWAISMICLLISLISFSRKGRKSDYKSK